MTVHLVFFRFKSDSDAETVRDGFFALKARIPLIRSLCWVRNNSTEGLDRGFLQGIRIIFDSVADRQAYLGHPVHLAFAKDLVIPALESGLKESVMVFDYEEE